MSHIIPFPFRERNVVCPLCNHYNYAHYMGDYVITKTGWLVTTSQCHHLPNDSIRCKCNYFLDCISEEEEEEEEENINDQ